MPEALHRDQEGRGGDRTGQTSDISRRAQRWLNNGAPRPSARFWRLKSEVPRGDYEEEEAVWSMSF
jgi:hypothetical protein